MMRRIEIGIWVVVAVCLTVTVIHQIYFLATNPL